MNKIKTRAAGLLLVLAVMLSLTVPAKAAVSTDDLQKAVDSSAAYMLQAVQGNMSREEAIEKIMLAADEKAIFVSTTGMASRELYELREKHSMNHEKDFLTVGSMGHASQIALSIAMQKQERKVYCIDGDGATIMQMGGLATIGSRAPKNLVHIVLNNGAHDSVGGQPTVARKIDLCGIAKSCGYEIVKKVESIPELEDALSNLENKLTFIEVLIKKGARKDLGRPKSTPIENKNAFMKFLNIN